MRSVLVFGLVAAVLAVGACASSKSKDKAPLPAEGPLDGAPPPPYDAEALPPPPPDADAGDTWHAVETVDITASQVVYALSDVHGGYDRLAALLAGAQITTGVPASPSAIQWGAGSGVLVVAGDLIDKGPQPIEVIDALQALQASAAAAGGRVVVLIGNHEAEFFYDPNNSKATATDGIDKELAAKGIDPTAVAKGTEPHGAWLRARPLGVKVGGWFFSHAGNTKGRSVADLDTALLSAIANHPDYGDPELVGADSILEARDWYTSAGLVTSALSALGASHIVFGHQPGALGPNGAIATAFGGQLMRIDCGMSPDVNDSTGCVLRIHRDGANDVAEQVLATGAAKEVFRGPP